MRVLKAEIQKLFASSYTRAMALTAFGVGIVLSVFDGINMLAAPERALDPTLVANFYTDTVYLAWVFPPVLGLLLMTSEFRWGTAIHTFLQTPRRGVVVGWKMLASTLGGALIAGASLLGAYLTATAVLLAVGDFAAPDSGRLVGATVAMILTGAVSAPLGVAIGALVRAQLAALAIFIGWIFLVEGALGAVAGPLGVYLPGQLMPRAVSLQWTPEALTAALSTPLSPLSAVVYLAVWAVLMGIIASYTTLRKDID